MSDRQYSGYERVAMITLEVHQLYRELPDYSREYDNRFIVLGVLEQKNGTAKIETMELTANNVAESALGIFQTLNGMAATRPTPPAAPASSEPSHSHEPQHLGS